MPKIPSYRQRSGSTQAIVTLTDSPTGKRRDYWLGDHGTPASRELYYRLIAEWEGLGRRFPERAEARSPTSLAYGLAGGAAPSRMPTPIGGTAGSGHNGRGSRAHGLVGDALDVGGGDGVGTDAVALAGLGTSDRGVFTVARLIIAYWRWAGSNHKFKRAFNIKAALRVLRRLDGSTPAIQFGPRKLRILREAMVLGDSNAVPPRKPWSRRTINDRIRVIVTMFRWAVSQELLPPSIPQALAMVEPLKRGRTTAHEGEAVGPVPQELIEAVRPLVSRQVRAIIDLQLLTGARPGELLGLRPVDIDTAGEFRGTLLGRRMGRAESGRAGSGDRAVWTCRLREHKNAFRGKDRRIFFGPRAQQILAPFMSGRSLDVPLFSPSEAEAERRDSAHAQRKTPIGYGNSPGTNKSPSPRRPARNAYSTDTYRRAIERACDEAFPPPETLARSEGETEDQWASRLTPSQRTKLRQWRKEHRWHPHQLRHNAATYIRREFGLEAASLVLGHASATITDAIYAERDQAKIAEVIRQVG